jgi:tetratricopeptide (TPR) repeat protein
LEGLGRREDALILVAGDHGEGLFEHGEGRHGLLTYQSTLRVPLLVQAPGAESGRVVDVPVQVADIGPTKDPDERNDLAPNDPGVGADLDVALADLLAAWAEGDATSEATAAVPVDPEAMQRLASLGYVGGAMTAERQGGPAPRDKVHLEGTILAGREQVDAGLHESALHTWRAILATDPENRYVLQEASYAAERTGNPDEAMAFAARLVDLYPEFLPGVAQLGMLHVQRGDTAKAVDIFRRGIEFHPDEASLRYRLVLALISEGELDEAESEIQRAIDGGSDAPEFLVARALCAAQRGRDATALSALDAAIAAGFDRIEDLRTEPLLEPLRRLPGFDARVAALSRRADD